MLDTKEPGMTKVAKVKAHADEEMVASSQVRAMDKPGSDEAYDAADCGRRRVSVVVIDSKRLFAELCGLWYPVVRDLHRFFIAIARVAVNEDESGRRLLTLVCGLLGLFQKKKVQVSNSGFCFSSWTSLALGRALVSTSLKLRHVLMMFWHGRTLLVSWLRFVLFGVLCIGLRRCVIIVLGRCGEGGSGGEVPILGFLSSVSFGLGSVLSVRRPFLGSVGMVGQFRCWPLLWVPASPTFNAGFVRRYSLAAEACWV